MRRNNDAGNLVEKKYAEDYGIDQKGGKRTNIFIKTLQIKQTSFWYQKW